MLLKLDQIDSKNKFPGYQEEGNWNPLLIQKNIYSGIDAFAVNYRLHSLVWCGGVVVIRSPHDPEVPSSNPGKNNTSDFSIRDPLSLPSCDWYNVVQCGGIAQLVELLI